MRATRPLVVLLLLAAGSCTQITEADMNMELAQTKGKFHVRLTEDGESVEGTCKFVRMITPANDPGKPPTLAELPDWFRTRAVYFGADTVIVRGNAGDAYICGPGPLNPDGTRQGEFPPPQPVPPTPTPKK
jgi:hypothetical protein